MKHCFHLTWLYNLEIFDDFISTHNTYVHDKRITENFSMKISVRTVWVWRNLIWWNSQWIDLLEVYHVQCRWSCGNNSQFFFFNCLRMSATELIYIWKVTTFVIYVGWTKIYDDNGDIIFSNFFIGYNFFNELFRWNTTMELRKTTTNFIFTVIKVYVYR